jgi:hypothetical protein
MLCQFRNTCFGSVDFTKQQREQGNAIGLERRDEGACIAERDRQVGLIHFVSKERA